MDLTLSVDDVIQDARRRAEAMGTTVDQLVRDFLEQFSGRPDADAAVAEFKRISGRRKAIRTDGASTAIKYTSASKPRRILLSFRQMVIT